MDKIKISQTRWPLWGLILFVIAITFWGAVIVPTEKKLISLSERSLTEGNVDPALIKLSRKWYNTATIFAVLIVIILVLMVYRPVF